MASDRELETLVQVITERVRAELAGKGGGATTASAPSAGGGHGHSHGPSHGHSHGHSHGGGATPGRPCTAGKGECTGCGWSVSRRPVDTQKIVDLGAARVAANAAGMDASLVRGDLARYIDHTLLKARASREELDKLCDEAARYKFASVCVNAANVAYCARKLRGSDVMVCAVVGFPLGAMTPDAKAFETREAVRSGASEIDMVINIGALKSKDYGLLLEDIRKVVEAAAPARVKVILETGELDHDEKVIACALSKVAGAAFVKTSTGFGPGGATAADVALMKQVVGAELEVKASGGVRTSDDVDKMIAAGATRIGASASIAIVQGAKSEPTAKATAAKRWGGGGY